MEYIVSMDEVTFIRYENIIKSYEKAKEKIATKYREEHPSYKKRVPLDRSIKWKVLETRQIPSN